MDSFGYHLYKRAALAVLFLALALSACARQAGPPAELSPTPQPVIQPTPTLAVSQVLLVSPPQADPALAASAEELLRELAGSAELELVVRQEAFQNDITPNIKVAVFLDQPDNLGSIAAAAPNTQFVAISDQDWSPPENVSIIRRREDHTAFMAGYMATVLAPNYRVGALLSAENPLFNQAFINGVYYFCGLCRAAVFPFSAYPSVAVLPGASGAFEWQNAFNEANTLKVNVLFVAPEAATPEVLAYLSGMDVALIGLQPPPEEGKPRWSATLYSDSIAPMRDIWEDLLAGRGGQVVNASINAADLQPVAIQEGQVWLSDGRMMLAQKVMDDLRNGLINPLPPAQ